MVKEYLKKIRELGIGKLLLILLAGILLVISGVDGTQSAGTSNNISTQHTYTGEKDNSLKEDMEQILRAIEGVEQVNVMITYENTGEKILVSSKNTENTSLNEQDSQGGIRSETKDSVSEEYLYTGETPYVIMEKNPKVCGVVVVYKGNQNLAKDITEAVKVLTDVDYNRIKVLLMN